MAMRIVAIVIIVALAAFVWWKRDKAGQTDQTTTLVAPDGHVDEDVPIDPVVKTPLFYNPDVEGVEPPEPADMQVSWELKSEGPRAVLYFTVTEAHGWYVDHVYVEFWHVEQDESGEWHQVGDSVRHLCKGYVDFNATLYDNTTLIEAEFPELEGDYGTTENWMVRVSEFNKVLAPKG